MPVVEDLLAFLDTETGGLIPGKDPVIEIAMILTDLKLKEFGRFNGKIRLRAGDKVSTESARVNGYDPEVWERDAVGFRTFVDFLKAHIPYGHVAIPVGHNVGFDRDMLDLGYFKPMRLFCPLSYRKVDTITIAMAMRVAGSLTVQDVKLGTVAAALGIEAGRAHTAMADCLTSKALFTRAVEIFRAQEVRSA